VLPRRGYNQLVSSRAHAQDGFDAIVIGAGPGGSLCAIELATAGLRVAIVERERVGGECSYWGCVPSKTLLRSIDPRCQSSRVPGSREAVTGAASFAKAASWRDENADNYDDGLHAQRITDAGATILRGTASISEGRHVRVDGAEYTFEHLVVATGSAPQILQIDGLSDVPFWTNREATAASAVPTRLIVLGAGAVGVELAQMFARYGSGVTVIDRSERILPNEDARVAKYLQEQLAAEGVAFKFGAKASSVSFAAGLFKVVVDGRRLEAEHLLVAAGRTPRTADLNLERLGVRFDEKGAVIVDDACRAANDVYAIGDVTNVGLMFTHVAKYQARIAAANILGRDARARYDAVPRCIFTDPEIGAVGRSAAELRAAGVRAVEVTVAYDEVARSVLYTEETTRGLLTLTAQAERHTLAGGAFVGPLATEMAGMLATAVRSELPVDTLADVVQAFPTFSELFYVGIEKLANELRQAG
jgi:pyruvate/2-oxoglutarate dehydrogenase complex dihydrolipoamide dehydrogenase (E3) component